MPLTVGQPVPHTLSRARVLCAGASREDAGSLVLEELWADGPAAIVFLRHFGCPSCADNVEELSPRLAELSGLGLRVALVGSGEPAHITRFVDLAGLGGRAVELFTDPTLEAYRAAGLVRSAWASYSPKSILEMARAISRGHVHARALGDPMQQGGTLVVERGGFLAFHHANLSTGGHTSAVELVDAALALRARSGEILL